MDRIWDKYPERKAPEAMVKALERITPLVLHHGRPEKILPVNSFTTAFLWDPIYTGPMMEIWEEDVKEVEITTLHTWAYYGFFKPTIAEVIAQIPEGFFEKTIAFYICESPQQPKDFYSNYEEKVIFDSGYHIAKTRIFVKG